MRRTKVKYIIAALFLLFVGIQFIQPNRANPPVETSATFSAIAKPSQPVNAALQRACGDCHSNETRWPWYSKIAPVSWLVASDVQEGRTYLNFSEWNRLGPDIAEKRLRKACSEMRKGEMPLWQYTLIHRNARITPDEVEAFCAAFASER